MNAAIRERRAARARRVALAADLLRDRGVNWTEWAAARGLKLQAVKDVLRGKPGTRGEAARAALLICVAASSVKESEGPA
ncbi:MAG: hypothetical protein F4Y47_00220 [Acidobacteriia bacterium]|nr:hypothetical protein [Terriglobia bacterium]MYG04411.1 hypothetical protein [Terriglobia bacterium]MYK11276.1 hypothetical protein [Terriglobia bacterium]